VDLLSFKGFISITIFGVDSDFFTFRRSGLDGAVNFKWIYCSRV